ncbi:hypothetical protein AgCh_032692 [Apium graveolens]
MTPNLLARTIETMKGGGLVILLLRKLASLTTTSLCTMVMGKAVITFLDAILDKTLRSTVALLATRGRGKSAALGLAISGAIDAGRYETIRVPILRPSENPLWKVNMAMFLKATDPEYLDRINEGPYKPTKLSVAVADQPAKMITKEKSEYIAEDISSIAKDARGTDAIKKNMRTILTQEYEHFYSKADESLTDLYDRDNYDLTKTTIDEIYGMLKTYELEMDQRSKRHGRKSRTVALRVEEKSSKVVVSKKGK